MCTHYPLSASCSPIRASQRHAKLLRIFMALMVVAVLLSSSALSAAASTGGSPDATQGTVTRAACYGVYHIVRPGQTLYSIAAAYGTTAYRIAMCNGLSSYTLYVGQALLIPTYRTR